MSSDSHSLLDRRLLLFTGKGGVGKSTVVASLAQEAAKRGKRPLIVELGHRASMEGIFGSPPIGYEATSVAAGVSAMNLDFQRSLQDYLAEHIPVKRVARAILDNRALQKFFEAAPSVSEVATLNKISSLVEEKRGGTFRWDPVLVDLDATGHALMLLSLPNVLDGLIGDGPMRRLVDGFSRLLGDPKRTALNLVTLARALPAQETLELYNELRSSHCVPLGALFINRIPSSPLSPELSDPHWLEQIDQRARDRDDELLSVELSLLRRTIGSYERAQKHIEELEKAVDLPCIQLPRLERAGDLQSIATLGEKMWTELAQLKEASQ